MTLPEVRGRAGRPMAALARHPRGTAGPDAGSVPRWWVATGHYRLRPVRPGPAARPVPPRRAIGKDRPTDAESGMAQPRRCGQAGRGGGEDVVRVCRTSPSTGSRRPGPGDRSATVVGRHHGCLDGRPPRPWNPLRPQLTRVGTAAAGGQCLLRSAAVRSFGRSLKGRVVGARRGRAGGGLGDQGTRGPCWIIRPDGCRPRPGDEQAGTADRQRDCAPNANRSARTHRADMR